MSAPEVSTLDPTEPPRRRRWGRWLLAAGVCVAVVLGGVGWYVWSQYRTLTSAKYTTVAYDVPDAPQLTPAAGETLYRIDPTQSSVSYAVDEKLFGQSTHRAEGTTNGIAGDLAINAANPAASRVGQITVNVEQLHSDNSLRDARIRSAYLASHDHPLAQLTVSELTGLPARIVEGQTYRFDMDGQLIVKGAPSPVTWDVRAKVADGKLTATAHTDVKMSTLGIGPISVAGLVSTGDDVALTLKVTALDPGRYTIPTQIAPPPGVPQQGDSPSFKNVVMPALRTSCASCHQPGEVGAAHWTLATADDAAKIADGIGTVVEARYMPPWPASSVGVPLAHSKQLDARTRTAIMKWAKAGGQLDVAGTTKITPAPVPAGLQPRHDVVMKMPQAYTGSASVPNDYRCFVLDPKITEPTYMTGYEVTPGVRQEIHHAQIFHIDATQVEASAALAGKDGKPGWSCYTGPSLRSTARRSTAVQPGTSRADAGSARVGRVRRAVGQAGLVAGWVPGQDPVIYPDHSGILLQPGDALVLQIHYHYDEGVPPRPDRSTVSAQLDPASSKITPLTIVNPIGPVEIPCEPGDTAPLCDRGAALIEAARQYGPAGSFIEPGLLGLCGKTIEELAATYHDGVASSSCDTKVPEDGRIVGAMGHMHTLGKSFRLTLDPDTPQAKVLLDIPTWNFDWQMNYELQTPIHVTAGQTVRMECSWDRNLDPTRPQKYIIFAEGTEDEMCFSTYAIIPDEAAPASG